ncbi:hypothetical protein ACS0TY_028251 [Phlomoides rotata]
MTKQAEALARLIIGIIGNVFSALLFIAPVTTFWRIIKNKSTEEFHPYPYIMTVMNCLCWIFYGLPIVHPDSTLVVTINSFGLFMEIVYLTIFFVYTKNKYRMSIVLFLLAEAALIGIIATITILCFHNTDTRSMFVGIICDIFGIIMYASPLTVMYRIWKTKSVEYLPFWLCLAGFCNGICWFTYGFLKKFDPYIVTGNGIGGLFGFIQLSVYFYYTHMAKGNNAPVQTEMQPKYTPKDLPKV